MNGEEYFKAPNIFSREELIRLREDAIKYGELEPDDAKCKGKSSESYWCHEMEHFSYVREARDRAFGEIEDRWGYDISDRYGCNFLYNIYKAPSGGYPWHIDRAQENTPFVDLKVTMIVNTSVQPYEGGELHVACHKVDDTHIKELDTPGSVILFRSHNLHRVAPVTSGERTSLTIFFKGPRWR